jgi:hypothetical protein
MILILNNVAHGVISRNGILCRLRPVAVGSLAAGPYRHPPMAEGGFFCISPRIGILQRSEGQVGLDWDLV